MQVKASREDEIKSCTSSIYISEPPVSSSSTIFVSDLESYIAKWQNGESNSVEQRPVLTIQVNQNNPPSPQNANYLVNNVSCFRAYPTAAQSDIENAAHNNNALFAVSVRRNNCDYSEGISSSDESKANKHVLTIETSSSDRSRDEVKLRDLNEISVDKIYVCEQLEATTEQSTESKADLNKLLTSSP